MMKRVCAAWTAGMLAVLLVLAPVRAAGNDGAAATNTTLKIASADNRPLSIDRLLYVACKSLGYEVAVSCPSVSEGYAAANSGTRDGVIASFPNLEAQYPNLRQVPVVLEEIAVKVFARPGSHLRVNNWRELDNLKIGLLSGRVYMLEHIPQGAVITEKETSKAVLDGLAAGEYDVAVLSERAHETLSERTDVACIGQVDALHEYLYLNRRHAAIIPALAGVFSAMLADGSAHQILNDLPAEGLNEKKTVIHITSTNSEIVREERFAATLREQFENDLSIEWYSVSLDSRRFSRDPNRLSYIAGLLRQDCVSRNIAAIVVSGEDALAFITSYYYLYFRNVPVLFYGVGPGYQDILHEYSEYFTGIVEQVDARDTLETALDLFPKTQTIHILNDSATEGVWYRERIESQANALGLAARCAFVPDVGLAGLLTYIRNLPANDLVLVGSYFIDADGRYYTLNEMKRFFERDCAAPVFSLYSIDVSYGALGGKAPDYGLYGEAVAGMLRRVLAGQKAADIPAITDSSDFNRWVFDKNMLDLHGISERALPGGATVINKIPPFWEADPRFALTLLALLASGVGAAVWLIASLSSRRKRRERRISEAKIREVKERLENIINSAPISYVLAIDNRVVEMNETFRQATGLEIGDELQALHLVSERGGQAFAWDQGGPVLSEIVHIRLAGGAVHRALLNVTSAEYEGRQAVIAWAVDIEDNERRKDELIVSRQEIREVKERLEWVIRTASFGYMFVLGGRVLEINENMKWAVGLNVGDRVAEVYSGMDRLSDVTERLRRREEVKNELVEVDFANGERHRCLINVSSFNYENQPATIVWMADIERYERRKDRLQVARQNLQTILDILPVAVQIADQETGRILYANNACLALLGFERAEDLYARLVYDTMPVLQSDGSDSRERMDRALKADMPVTVEFEYYTAAGKTVDTQITACSIEYIGRKARLGIFQDLTQEKEYQIMLANTAEREREANLLKSRFLVNMSHEIRTPMNVIIGLTEIELHRNRGGEAGEVYQKINTSAKNLLTLINDILDISKIEADKITLYDEEFELEEVLNSAMLVATPRLEDKNAEFLLNQALDLPRFLVGDRTRLWQILKNFLDNSAKYTERGKIVLTVFADSAQSTDQTVMLHFIIEDTGIGMDEAQIERVFLPYEQIYNSAQKKYTGTGLGMAISKQLCELMGGRLQIEARLGVGTVVHLSIPFKRSARPETGVRHVSGHALEGVDVLAVDDDTLARKIIAELLEAAGARCTLAQNGMEAMEIVRRYRDNGAFFDVILLDYMMDGLNGLETARQIQLALSKVPKLLMVTAYQQLLVKTELERNGIDGVIEKPFVPSYFIRKLCEALGFSAGGEEKEKKAFTKFQNVRVLLCEDYHLNQEVGVGMLSQFGVEAVVVENGAQCVKLLSEDDQFDLIFMDLQMPVMDGYEATRIIRSDARLDAIPIISMTADAMKEVVEQCLAMGMNDHLAKPIAFDSLHRVLQSWLPESKRAAQGGVREAASDARAEALARFGGSRAHFEDALDEFAGLLPDVWQDFDQAVQDAEATSKFLHKLKGAAGALGEEDIYQLTAAFEGALRGGVSDPALYARLAEACARAKAEILGRDRPAAVAAPEKHGTQAEFAQSLAALKEALQDYDPVASAQALGALKQATWPTGDTKKLNELYAMAQRYDFEAAIDVLLGLMEGSDE